MTRIADTKPSSARLAEVNPQALERYQAMRSLLMPPAGVDAATAEIAIAAQLALLGHEVPFKIHAMRALDRSVSRQQLQAILLAGVGVTMVMFEAARALRWLDEACEEQAAT